ncbi:DEAD/DEAH box helicase [Lysobacter sp. GX 14042]|uniref:DEAD/DEAH box helicase n=1 Tax=Lysobacter sp. GX 14042 TaxID=2907155 RepID=UPI001F3D4FC8|nr:DEAD/DEAH box helicase [Lysobacter sp. GX 14042]MCE7031555.1 DEAD/DEAH box helicase [Lysobacter sp. GX 14042]
MSADIPTAGTGDESPETPLFSALGLPEPLLRASADLGYERPSPIQAATIPPLLEGRDVLGQAQTGTGKTAAFALPILARLDPTQKAPQALVLAPTRELAIQVAEAFQSYAAHLPGFTVLPIYGGQSYYPQLQALKRGVQVVVGTPGRIIDHLDRGSLDLSQLRCLVLDEADEMLRMGFIDDVEAVLKKTPEGRQVALFSATMPVQIRRIAQTYLNEPVEISIRNRTSTAANIRQRYWAVSGMHKLDALTRILEAEPFEAMIVFARTKLGTEELAEKLAARGIAAAAINGDVQQAQREKTIAQLKDGRIDVLVATDVAARGLDVDRISHVLNYDIPYDTESYVHRIGRTGRAGRKGEAILFVTPRERGMLRAIERATRQPIEQMALPTIDTVNEQRVSRFLDRITETLAANDLALYRDLVERYQREHNVPVEEIAAALARLAQGERPLLLDAPRQPERKPFERAPFQGGTSERPPRERPQAREHTRPAAPQGATATAQRQPASSAGDIGAAGNAGEMLFPDDAPPMPTRTGDTPPRGSTPPRGTSEYGSETFRIEVGHDHGVKPGNIVGAIANEAELDSRHIGRIDIRDDHSFVDLPEGMPPDLLQFLKKVRVAGQPLRISRAGEEARQAPHARRGPPPRGPRPPHRNGPPRPGPRKPRPPR